MCELFLCDLLTHRFYDVEAALKFNHIVLVCFVVVLSACSQFPKATEPSAPRQHVPQVSTDLTATSSNRNHATNLKTNKACIDIIREFEGVRLDAYQGPAGYWLIGYGHKAGVNPEMKITQERANKYLQEDLADFENSIRRNVKVPVTQNEFSAMVCLAYNIGSGNFKNSTVLKEINQGNRKAAADAFLMWNKVRGQVNSHQVKRRKLERDLFVKP